MSNCQDVMKRCLWNILWYEILSLKESYEILLLNVCLIYTFVITNQLILMRSWFLGTSIVINNTVTGDDQTGGCPSKYSWCYTSPLLPLPQFFVAATLVGIGYSVGQVVHNVLYSQILGPLPQVNLLIKSFFVLLVLVITFFRTGYH